MSVTGVHRSRSRSSSCHRLLCRCHVMIEDGRSFSNLTRSYLVVVLSTTYLNSLFRSVTSMIALNPVIVKRTVVACSTQASAYLGSLSSTFSVEYTPRNFSTVELGSGPHISPSNPFSPRKDILLRIHPKASIVRGDISPQTLFFLGKPYSLDYVPTHWPALAGAHSHNNMALQCTRTYNTRREKIHSSIFDKTIVIDDDGTK